ncbi:MAG: DUF4189 domain-containing protein [Azonexus sp.]|jgi:hypothetical protein|nr:DUF4189 domain-containing protein [Azonexus sp.]
MAQMISRRRLLALLALWLGGLLLPLSLAQADAVCGPWLRVVGKEHGAGWSAPICAPEAEGDGGGSGFTPATASHYLEYVLHPDSTAIWIATGYPSRQAAHEAAFKGCTAALGAGCYGAVGTSGDVFIGFAEDAQGNTAIGGGNSKAEAEASALAACRQGEPLIAGSCRFVDGVRNTSSPRHVFPAGLPLRVFAAVAVLKDAPKPGEKWAGTAWLATGITHGGYPIAPANPATPAGAAPQGGIEAAQAAAIARCAEATGLPCVISNVAYSTDYGLIARYASAKNTLYVGVPSPEAAHELEQQLASDGLGLSLAETFAARPERVLVIEDKAAAAPPPKQAAPKAPPKKPPQRRPQSSSKRTMSSSPK